LSRSLYPKQLLPVASEASMLQVTAARVPQAKGFGAPIVVAGEDHRFLIADQLRGQSTAPAAILLEPAARNTAAAIALAANLLLASDPDALMLVMPSDHVIADVEAFHQAVQAAVPAAQKGRLVTFGIKPGHPETGYGYIEVGDSLSEVAGVNRVARFVEKPDAETAKAYVESGRHAWNGGIFLFMARTVLGELEQFEPAIARACSEAMAARVSDGVFVRPSREPFLSSPNVSIDYAVMERTTLAAVVPVEMGWSDVGSWDALWDISSKDQTGNATKGDVVAVDTKGSLLRQDGGPAIAAVGVSDMVVVSTRDAVLVAPRSRAQDVKHLVDELKGRGSEKPQVHTQVHRPWGTYETMDRGERFQTKRIVVKPGEKLSLQMHHHRSEHWIVVSGTARVVVDDKVSLLQENQSIYIPAGSTHRLENPGKIPLHLIEVQCGSYLGEDDIVRFEDSYGRVP
jgi:mannose-1-phosphate guanylyltransferase/mannose-6-phosphate isomerase